MTLRQLLGLRPKADDSAALAASLAATETALVATRFTVATLEGERGAILLDATPSEAEAHERRLAEARGEAERLVAMAAALPARIAAAEEREHAAELDKLAIATETAAEAGAAMLPRIMRDLAAVAELMRQHDTLVEEVNAATRTLRRGGREAVELPMRRLWPDPSRTHPVTFGFDRASFGGGTVFAAPPGNAIGAGSVGRWLASKTPTD